MTASSSIEHNLEVIKCADYLVDLGPEAGSDGGLLVAVGTPEEVARVEASHTGYYLRPLLDGERNEKMIASGGSVAVEQAANILPHTRGLRPSEMPSREPHGPNGNGHANGALTVAPRPVHFASTARGSTT